MDPLAARPRHLARVVVVGALVFAALPLLPVRPEPQVGTKGDNLLVGLGGPSTLRAGGGDDILAGDSMNLPGVGPVRGIAKISTNATGGAAEWGSVSPAFSPDGTKVAFASGASNLVSGDRNRFSDIFLKDLASGAIVRISIRADGGEANGYSLSPAFSPDGSMVAFESIASNLVPDDRNNGFDVFVYHLASGAIERVSTRSDGVEAHHNWLDTVSISPEFASDSQRIVFESNANNLVEGDNNSQMGDADDEITEGYDIFVKNIVSGEIIRVSTQADGAEANDNSWDPVFSPDGTKVAFISTSDNLVPGDTNGRGDVFVKDLQTGAIELASTRSDGGQADHPSREPAFSPDSKKIAFKSWARNLVAGDRNKRADVFVKDLVTGGVERVSLAADGSEADGGSGMPVFSPDGTRIAFESAASDLVEGDTNGDGESNDIFVKNLATGAIRRVSTGAAGSEANAASALPVFSPVGTKVAFQSDASNLVRGDTNDATDVFVKDVVSAEGGNDILLAGAGDDRVYGGPGNDTMTGNAGDDLLVGGAGQDTIVFSARPGPGNVDRVAGYVPADDRIWLSSTAFPEAGKPGPLAKAAFKSGTTNAATSPRHRIIHNRRDGVLLYDPDGTGTRAAVPFARLEPRLRLDVSEFRIVE